eukprot:14625008-Alexandrium_andersonii.AAC.1
MDGDEEQAKAAIQAALKALKGCSALSATARTLQEKLDSMEAAKPVEAEDPRQAHVILRQAVDFAGKRRKARDR